MNLGTALRIAVMAIKLFIKYGPVLVELGMKIYRKVEELSRQRKLDKEKKEKRVAEKQTMFGDLIKTETPTWTRIMGVYPSTEALAEYREDIWEKMNPGKRSAYRPGKPRRRSGKTRRRG